MFFFLSIRRLFSEPLLILSNTRKFGHIVNTKNLDFNTLSVSTMMEELLVQKGDPYLLHPPSCVRGMKDLDRKMFTKQIIVPWVKLGAPQLNATRKCLNKYFLKVLNFKPIQPLFPLLEGEQVLDFNFKVNSNEISMKRAFLNPLMILSFNDLNEDQKNTLKNVNLYSDSFHYSRITLFYKNWGPDEIIKSVLPEDKECLTSYSLIGHIIHVNIFDHLLPYKQIVGNVLLDKVNVAKTVVNKTDIIDNTYRNFKMEILCGEDNMVTLTRENGCRYELDFSKVYWNPRLSTEHERINAKLKEGDVLYDVCAGIGPFSIPAAKKRCHVLANDLNPESFKWLQHNLKLNKVELFMKVFNKDGKEFLQDDVKKDILEKWKSEDFIEKNMHITMNLPALAVTFLPVFRGMFSIEELKCKTSNLIVHVYCFTKGDDPENIARIAVEHNLGIELDRDHLIEIFKVRNVSNRKDMMRVSFVLPQELLVGNVKVIQCQTDTEEPPKKKFHFLSDVANSKLAKSLLRYLYVLFSLQLTIMGKQKTKKIKSNNVFKVVGAKSLKTKKKAKAVSSQLKNLTELTRKQTAEADGRLSQLQSELLQGSKKVNKEELKRNVKEPPKKPYPEIVQPSETLAKFCEMQM